MLKPTLNVLFPIATLALLVMVIFFPERKILLVLVGIVGALSLVVFGIIYWFEAAATIKKRQSDLRYRIKRNYSSVLRRMKMIKEESDLTEERTHKLSQDEDAKKLLKDDGYEQILDDLEEFDPRYNSGEKKRSFDWVRWALRARG